MSSPATITSDVDSMCVGKLSSSSPAPDPEEEEDDDLESETAFSSTTRLYDTMSIGTCTKCAWYLAIDNIEPW